MTGKTWGCCSSFSRDTRNKSSVCDACEHEGAKVEGFQAVPFGEPRWCVPERSAVMASRALVLKDWGSCTTSKSPGNDLQNSKDTVSVS